MVAIVAAASRARDRARDRAREGGPDGARDNPRDNPRDDARGSIRGTHDRSRDALASLAATLLPQEVGGPDPHHLAGILDDYLSRAPFPTREAIVTAAAALDVSAAVLLRAGPLHGVDLATRERFLRRLQRSGPAMGLLEALKALVLLAHGAEEHAPSLLARAEVTPLARPDPPLNLVRAVDHPDTSSADVVVIGSGAGGAMAALELASHGLDVVVVEEGRQFSVEEFRTKHPLDRWRELYRSAGTTVALGSPPILLPVGRGVGGTTLVNSGTCFRTPPRVLAEWRDRHGVAMADPDEFATYLDVVERTIRVAPVPMDVMGRNGELTIAGATELGWSTGPLDRNAPGCVGSCQCALGCPRNAKAGVHQNALPQACEAGALIVSEAHVQRVLHDHGRASGVEVRRRDGSTLTIRAPRVVVACGTTETPPLLQRSGLGGHRQLGRNLAIHPAIGIAGRFDEPVTSWLGVLQSAQVDAFHASDGIMLEATAMPPGMGSIGLPGYGRDLVEELARAEHYATLGAMIADRPSGSVHRVGRRTLIRYQLSRSDGQRLLKSVALMGRVMLAAGAREVVTGLPGVKPLTDVAAIDRAVAHTDRRGLHLSAYHPTGTARLGRDPRWSPVDPEGRLRGTRGVYVADGAAVPTCPEVNPQVTIMALALGVARRIARHT